MFFLHIVYCIHGANNSFQFNRLMITNFLMFIAALYAASVQENLIYHFGQRKVYLFGMFAFSVSLLGTVLSNSLLLVNLFAALSGLGLAAITTIPYSLTTEYYKKREVNIYF